MPSIDCKRNFVCSPAWFWVLLVQSFHIAKLDLGFLTCWVRGIIQILQQPIQKDGINLLYAFWLFISRVLIFLEFLPLNSGYSNPNILEPSFFCRAFGNLLEMVELIFSRITDASFSVFVDISISHLWFDRGETHASPIFSMQCLDMLRKTISNLFWVNWLSFGRDLSPGFSVAISCWHSSIIRFPPAKKRSPPRTPPFYEIFNSAFGT